MAGQPRVYGRELSPPSGMEPTTLKRRDVGFRGYDPARACPGFTLFTPLAGKTVYLIDLQGTVVHTWQMPYPPGNYGYLTDRGTLFYNGNMPNDSYVGRSRTTRAPRWKWIGAGASSGKSISPTIITMADSYKTATSCWCARPSFQPIWSPAFGVVSLAPSTKVAG